MFEIERKAGNRARLAGRFDALQEARARQLFEQLEGPCTLELGELVYVSSVGLGLLLALQQRLAAAGGVTLSGVNPHIRELLKLAGLDQFFVFT